MKPLDEYNIIVIVTNNDGTTGHAGIDTCLEPPFVMSFPQSIQPSNRQESNGEGQISHGLP